MIKIYAINLRDAVRINKNNISSIEPSSNNTSTIIMKTGDAYNVDFTLEELDKKLK